MRSPAAITSGRSTPRSGCARTRTTSTGTTSRSRSSYYSAGITKVQRSPGDNVYFRAAANTGALYHVDLYLACRDLPDLPAGIYHFGAHDFALRRLRVGDYRGAFIKAAGVEPSLAQAPVIVASASTYWRNAWKYQDRAYRHAFWDGGTLHANLLAVAAARSARENGRAASACAGRPRAEPRDRAAVFERDRRELFPLRPLAEADWPAEPLESVILRRGSTRRFDVSRSLTFEELSTALAVATASIPADFTEDPESSLLDL